MDSKKNKTRKWVNHVMPHPIHLKTNKTISNPMQSLEINKLYSQKSHPGTTAHLLKVTMCGNAHSSTVRLMTKANRTHELGLISFQRNWTLL